MEKARRLIGAADIGGTKITVGIVNGAGQVLLEETFPSAAAGTTAETAVDRMATILSEQCASLGLSLTALQGIGVSCAGPIDRQKGTVENPYTLPGWEGYPLAARLTEATGLVVHLENDANGALLGEVMLRGLQDKRVLMVTLGTGIGVACRMSGDLYRSGHYHPEMGHIIVASEGDRCYCGHRGCFESCCSGSALNARAVGSGYTNWEALADAATNGNQTAAAAVTATEQAFRNGFWSLNIIFKPQVLILAGGFAKRHFAWLSSLITQDSAGKADFLGSATILPASENINPALPGANLLF